MVAIKDQGYRDDTSNDAIAPDKQAIRGVAQITIYADLWGLTGAANSRADENSFWRHYLENGSLTPAVKNKFTTLLRTVIKEGEWFEDHTFEMVGPVQEDLIVKDSALHLIMPKHYKITSNYNYYVPEYEAMLADEISEALLPNLYAVLDTSTYAHPHAEQADDIIQHVHHGARNNSLITPALYKELYTKYNIDTKRYGFQTGFVQKDEYFTEFSKQHYETNFDFTLLEKKFTNILISDSHTPHGGGQFGANLISLQALNAKKEIFPMYIEIKFSRKRVY